MHCNVAIRYTVSISDEKPVPSPQHAQGKLSGSEWRFQSQMRSQFPRHLPLSLLCFRRALVSISDEKPVPSPLGVPPVRATFVTLFQSQMRSQFPRHAEIVAIYRLEI